MDTLRIQINLRSFINQMDASSWFVTPFWFKCRFFCNVVGLWRRYKYTVDTSLMVEVRIWKPLWSCLEGSYSDSEVPKFEKTHRQSSPLSWYLCYCTYLVATASLLAPPPRINEKCPCKSSAARLATSHRIHKILYHFTLLICFLEFSYSFPSFCW